MAPHAAPPLSSEHAFSCPAVQPPQFLAHDVCFPRGSIHSSFYLAGQLEQFPINFAAKLAASRVSAILVILWLA